MGDQERESRLSDKQELRKSNAEQFILRNLALSNRQLAEITGLTRYKVKHILRKQQIRRTNEQLEQIYFRKGQNQLGELNPNWRGGISKDFVRYRRIQAERYPERIKARELARRAHKKGSLKKLDHCESCYSKERLHFHHEDYSRPLFVKTVCNRCNEKLKYCTWEELLEWNIGQAL